ncbi:hypothetical protein BH10PSE3_BH10PSE3_38700 [soil metagenome]
MQTQLNPSQETVGRPAQIISVVELNRARSLRVLARDPGAPGEVHPWCYAFPRPSMDDSTNP